MRYRGTARFCGVKFYIPDDQEVSGGKRLVRHSYPFKNEHGIDNMGDKIDDFHVTGILLGDDYMRQFRSLKRRLDSQEVGRLVHPGFPRGLYYCEEYTLRFSGYEQRIAYLEMSLVPAGEEISPLVGENTLASLLDGINSALESMIDDLEALWQPFDDALDLIDSVYDIADTLDYGASFLMGNSRAHEVIDQISDIRQNASSLVRKPRELMLDVGGVYRTMRLISSPLEQYTLYRSMMERFKRDRVDKVKEGVLAGGDELVPIIGVADVAINDQIYYNANLLHQLCGGFALIYKIGALSRYLEDFYLRERNNKRREPTFKVRENPIVTINADRDDVSLPNLRSPIKTDAELSELMIKIADYLESLSFALSRLDANFISIQDLRLLFIHDIKSRINITERTFNYIPKSTLPSLAILQRAKANTLENETFVERNGLRNPLFCKGGQSYEVKRDDQ